MIESSKELRIIVVGSGSIGMRHIEILKSMPGVAVTAVPLRSGRAEELRLQGIDSTHSLDEALRISTAGVIIASATGLHVEHASRCAEVSPVLVEKPLAPTAEIARPLATAPNLVHVACPLRFDVGLNWIRARLPKLGSLRLADGECLSWLPAWRPQRDHRQGYAANPAEGGVLRDLIHEIDYCQWLFGPVRRIVGHLENSGVLGLPDAVDETASLTLQHICGLTTNLRLSFAVRPSSRRLRIFGDCGSLEWDGVARQAAMRDQEGQVVDETRWPGPGEMYQAQAAAWIDSLLGKPSPQLVSAQQGIAALEVCDAARLSSTSGRWVELS